RFANGFPIPGVLNGWTTSRERSREAQAAVWILDPPLELAAADRLVLTLKTDSAGCVRLSTSPLAPVAPGEALPASGLAAALTAHPASGAPPAPADQRAALSREHLLATAWDPEAFRRAQPLRRQIAACDGGRAFTMITRSREPLVTRVLPRGNWQDES